ILMVDITSGTNINAHDYKQIPPQSKSVESLIQEPNSSVPEDCELTGECTCVIGECEPCTPIELTSGASYCGVHGNKEEIKCEWNDTSKNGSLPQGPQYRPCRRVKRFEKAKYIEFQV
ncbi:2401_t:CDS:2, partial [Racocetra fulgida]